MAKRKSKQTKNKRTAKVVGAIKSGAKRVSQKKDATKKKVDDILLRIGPSIQSTLQKVQERIGTGVSKVEDVKKVGLQILQNAQKISESLKGKKKKS